MRAPLLVGIVAALHIGGITALVIIQGCGTTSGEPRFSRIEAEPPPPPPMPPVARVPAVEPPATFPRTAPEPGAPAVSPPAGEGTMHVVSKGDTLSGIAQRYGVSTKNLVEYNNLSDPNQIRIEQKILIPPYAKRPGEPISAASTSPAAGSAAPAVAGSETYVVQSGDTLSRIAKRQGTTVRALKEVNALTSDLIRVGQKLKLPAGSSGGTMAGRTPESLPPSEPEPALAGAASPEPSPGAQPAPTSIEDIPVPGSPSAPASPAPEADALSSLQNKPITYTVMEGDSIEDLAKLFIVSKEDIIEINNLEPGQSLRPGQTITIPQGSLR